MTVGAWAIGFGAMALLWHAEGPGLMRVSFAWPQGQDIARTVDLQPGRQPMKCSFLKCHSLSRVRNVLRDG